MSTERQRNLAKAPILIRRSHRSGPAYHWFCDHLKKRGLGARSCRDQAAVAIVDRDRRACTYGLLESAMIARRQSRNTTPAPIASMNWSFVIRRVDARRPKSFLIDRHPMGGNRAPESPSPKVGERRPVDNGECGRLCTAGLAKLSLNGGASARHVKET